LLSIDLFCLARDSFVRWLGQVRQASIVSIRHWLLGLLIFFLTCMLPIWLA
jgi:hypothetical protein